MKRRCEPFRIWVALLPALCAASMIAPVPAAAQVDPEPGQPPAGWEDLTGSLEEYVTAGGIVGASAVAVREGRIVARYDLGYADVAGGIRVGPRTIYHWGSITKTLTAIAIMQLRDRGLLSLDDRVTYWVPELRRIHDPYGAIDSITIEMLLTHSAGLQNPTWPWTTGRDWEPFEPTTWNQLVAMMPYQELLFRPGERYSYSNPGFIYLARIIEALTGDAWQAYVQKNILSPLGLTRSYFGTTPYWLAQDRSHNYDVVSAPDGATELIDNGADFDPGITIPNGGWNAPLEDLATYAAFLSTTGSPDPATQQRWEAVLSRSTLAEMWVPRLPVSEDETTGRADSLGLSFFVVHDGGRTVIGHTGSQAGYRAFFYFQPAKEAAVILVFNTANEVAGEEADRAFEAMLQAAFVVADPVPVGAR